MAELKDVRNDYHGVTNISSDIDNTETNIALLAFKVATGDSLTKFDMVDQVIDEYIDSSGIDTINSTNELLETGYVRGETIVGSTPTGGIVTTYGSTVVNTFLASGDFTTPSLGLVDVLVVAGGGGGGNHGGAGGGAGGVRQLTGIQANGVNAIVVGAGGPANQGGGTGGKGGTSSALGQVVTGGGYGGNWDTAGGAGGSGGGGGGNAGGGGRSGGSGNQGGYSPSEGNGGGPGAHSPGTSASGGGGGGAGGGGSGASGAQGGPAGNGVQNDYRTGSNIYYGGGGGGGAFYSSGGGSGGLGGGGHGYDTLTAGDPNTGGGGGGGYHYGGSGAVGGSGIVVIKYADDTFLQSAEGDLVLVSTATTAETTDPTTGDIVMLIEDNLGTATYGSTPGTGDDLRAYVSRDDGTTWAEGTITNEGTWGTDKKILVARDIDISSQPSGQSMRYRLETYNQTPAGTIKTCTANGNVHTDTTIKKFGTASAQFDGTGDYISIPDSDDWSFGGSDFTIDMWIRPASMGNFIIIGQREAAFGWEILMSGSNIHFWTPSGNFGQDPAMSIGDITDTWTHIAIVRSGATLRMFKNGERLVMVNDATTGTGGTTMADVTSVVSIGARTGGTYYPFEGYIDEIRVSHAAHYTSNFTPSTAPYTPDSYYKLLMHMDGADSGTTFTDDYWTGKGTNIHATSLAWK